MLRWSWAGPGCLPGGAQGRLRPRSSPGRACLASIYPHFPPGSSAAVQPELLWPDVVAPVSRVSECWRRELRDNSVFPSAGIWEKRQEEGGVLGSSASLQGTNCPPSLPVPRLGSCRQMAVRGQAQCPGRGAGWQPLRALSTCAPRMSPGSPQAPAGGRWEAPPPQHLLDAHPPLPQGHPLHTHRPCCSQHGL